MRYRVNFRLDRQLRATGDIVFTRAMLAVFLDGCFWHQCPVHATSPKSNIDYWEPKLKRNVERDVEVTKALTERGWQVLRFWEHEDPEEVADEITMEVAKILTR